MEQSDGENHPEDKESMNGAKISIIIPMYNVEDYLAKCLESCIRQTLFDIEIICVDDGSTDSSGKIADTFAQKDRRITVIHRKNGGLPAARNTGLDAATGQWIMFLDSDDYLSENACERVWVESNGNYLEIMAFSSMIFPEYPTAPLWYKKTLTVQPYYSRKFDPKTLFYRTGGKPFVWRQAYSHEFLKRTGMRFDEDMRYGEDIVFQFEAFPQANFFSFIPDKLYHYRWTRPGSLMEATYKDAGYRVDRHFLAAETITRFWKEKGWISKYPIDFMHWFTDFILYDLVKNKLKKDELAKDLLTPEEKKTFGQRAYAIAKENDLLQYAHVMDAYHRKIWRKTVRKAGKQLQ